MSENKYKIALAEQSTVAAATEGNDYVLEWQENEKSAFKQQWSQ